MTYCGFLLRFIGVPLAILALLTLWDWRQGRTLPADLRKLPARLAERGGRPAGPLATRHLPGAGGSLVPPANHPPTAGRRRWAVAAPSAGG